MKLLVVQVFLAAVVAITRFVSVAQSSSIIPEPFETTASITKQRQRRRRRSESIAESIHRHALSTSPLTITAATDDDDDDDDGDDHSGTSIQQVCSPNGDGVVFPDDDFNVELFHDNAGPICNCYEEDNTDSVLLSLVGDNSTNVTQYLTKLNKAFAKIVGLIEYDCINTCEHCFTTTGAPGSDNEYCGILHTSENTTYRGVEGNFTIEEYSSGKISTASWDRLFSESTFSISTCISYTKHEFGTLCYGSNFYNISTTPTCHVQYNDTLCNSCTFPNRVITTDSNVTRRDDCFIADCSNIVSDANMIDTCDGTGYDGIFRFIGLIANGVQTMKINATTTATVTAATVGSCDGPPTESPTMAPISTQQASPISLISVQSSSTWTIGAIPPFVSLFLVVGVTVIF